MRRRGLLVPWSILITAASFAAEPTTTRPGRPVLQRFDKDGDGKLSAEEQREARRQIQRARARGKAPASAPAAKVPNGVKALRDIEYARVGDKRLLLDLYLPEKADGRLPVVVWIHGGGWRGGSKNACRALYLSGKGYAVASIAYRLTPEATFPAQIHDCKGAIRWLRANAKRYGLDPNRIGVWGSSAGGHLVALLGTSGGVKELEGNVGGNLEYSSGVQAVCDFCGPTTLTDRASLRTGESEDGPTAVVALLGGPIPRKEDLARQASPVTHVTKDDPPFLVVHGDQDNVVPIRQSELLAEALKKAGVEVTFHVARGSGHGIQGKDIDAMVEAFFDKHLRRRS